jgi:uncharacterized membrane protein YccC
MPAVLFTSANAAEMAAKSHAKKKERVEELRQALNLARQPTEDFREDLLHSVRGQMRIISKAIDEELERVKVDHRALAALAATLSTCESIEQKLSMRAGPGNLKPSAPRKARVGSFAPPPPADDGQG